MYQDSYIQPIRTITCLVHKKQKATHICTQLGCTNNPVLCGICLQQSKFRSLHITHESSLKPINQAVQIISQIIKKQIKSSQSIYQKTIGHKDNELIKNNLQKMDYLIEQIQNRINSIKMQMDLQIQILLKQFQRQILLQKQQFLKKLDQYKKTFFTNLDILRKQSNQLMNFQTSLKFYSNPNTLLLKLSTQAQKRSLDWIIQQKKTLFKISKNQSSSAYIQSQSYSTLSSYINKVNDMNMMIKPVWMGQKKQLQSEKQLKNWIRSNIQSWISIPQLKDLSRSISHQQTGSHHSSSHDYKSINSYSQQGGIYSNSYSNNMI